MRARIWLSGINMARLLHPFRCVCRSVCPANHMISRIMRPVKRSMSYEALAHGTLERLGAAIETQGIEYQHDDHDHADMR